MPVLMASANMEPTVEKIRALDTHCADTAWAGEPVLRLASETLAAADSPFPHFSESLRLRAQGSSTLHARSVRGLRRSGGECGPVVSLSDPDADDVAAVCKTS